MFNHLFFFIGAYLLIVFFTSWTFSLIGLLIAIVLAAISHRMQEGQEAIEELKDRQAS